MIENITRYSIGSFVQMCKYLPVFSILTFSLRLSPTIWVWARCILSSVPSSHMSKTMHRGICLSYLTDILLLVFLGLTEKELPSLFLLSTCRWANVCRILSRHDLWKLALWLRSDDDKVSSYSKRHSFPGEYGSSIKLSI